MTLTLLPTPAAQGAAFKTLLLSTVNARIPGPLSVDVAFVGPCRAVVTFPSKLRRDLAAGTFRRAGFTARRLTDRRHVRLEVGCG